MNIQLPAAFLNISLTWLNGENNGTSEMDYRQRTNDPRPWKRIVHHRPNFLSGLSRLFLWAVLALFAENINFHVDFRGNLKCNQASCPRGIEKRLIIACENRAGFVKPWKSSNYLLPSHPPLRTPFPPLHQNYCFFAQKGCKKIKNSVYHSWLQIRGMGVWKRWTVLH